ncbi:MAG: PHP domain-containing protein [Candidatus Omnitrophota bacterium]
MPSSPKKKCDLHIHSTFSDSDTDIEQIFQTAQSKNLSAIAIADHDTIDGLALADVASQKYNIELVNAIEISAQKDDTEVHVLGYFIDAGSPQLKVTLESIRQLRKKRLMAMVAKLHDLGFAVGEEELSAKIKDAIPTRLHLGLYLVEKKIVKSLHDAFEKYLSPGKPAYIARFKYSIPEAIQLIKCYGGLAFLAHPHLLPAQSWIEEFVSYGLDGLEVVYPRFSEAKISLYKNMAEHWGLLKSGGSDAHGSYKNYTAIGSVTAPYEWVEEMKKRLAQRPRGTV